MFIASNPEWAKRFSDANVPIIGDDIKAQLGATIVHRVLTDLFAKRGVKLDRTYQLNTGGNTDFLNMSNRKRLASKKVSKTEAVQSVAAERLEDENIHVGLSDYVAWQNDNKICFLRMEGQLFGGVPMNLELRLSVEEQPELGRRRDRHDPLRQARARSRPGRPDRRCLGLFLQASAHADDRRPRPDRRRGIHRSVIDTAILLAAGEGSRLRALAPYKPLCVVGGKTLLEHAITGFAAAGIGRVIVVLGYGADAITRRPRRARLAGDGRDGDVGGLSQAQRHLGARGRSC